MSEEINTGAVLGGRYEVGKLTVTTEEGDMVFDGVDQVLNREVSILAASQSSATRLAVAAREIAIETRPSPVQVLDLGIHQSTTYLIAAAAEPADLLDLVVESGSPYVEPFMTDTLGSELFGESRPNEPHVYEDDAEYYEELAQEQARRPLFSGLADRMRQRRRRHAETGDAKETSQAETDDAADGSDANASVEKDESSTQPSSDEQGSAQAPQGESSDQDTTQDQPQIQAPGTLPPVTTSSAGTEDGERTGPITQVPMSASAASQESSQRQSEDQKNSDEEDHGDQDRAQEDSESSEAGKAGAAAAAVTAGSSGAKQETREEADARAAREAYERSGEMRPASRFPRAAAGAAGGAGGTVGSSEEATGDEPRKSEGAAASGAAASGAAASGAGAAGAAAAGSGPGAPGAGNGADDDYEENHGNKWTRVIVGAILALVMLAGVIFAVGNLTKGGDNQHTAEQGESSSAGHSDDPTPEDKSEKPSETEKKAPAPKIGGITRTVPDAQELNAETDGQLSNAIDGSMATTYQTYTYATPNFGGYTENFALALELEKATKVSKVTLEGLNGVGGNMQILVGDSPELSSATEKYSGSFSGPTLEASLGSGAEGKYVFVNITQLPQMATGASAERPYGFQVAEISVE